MTWVRNVLRGFAQGAGTGVGITLVASLFGFLGGSGWQPAVTGRVLSVVLLLLLIFLLGVVLTAEYGRHVGLRLTVEEHAKRIAMIPFLLGMFVVVMAAFLWIQPPPLADVPPPP